MIGLIAINSYLIVVTKSGDDKLIQLTRILSMYYNLVTRLPCKLINDKKLEYVGILDTESEANTPLIEFVYLLDTVNHMN